MLKRLKIENLALLENSEIEFDSGLSTITGETGGGKSVIVTALSLVFGGRAEREFIRHGANRATIAAEFVNSNNTLKIHRSFTRDGAATVKINGQKATVADLKTVGEEVGEILGQHASQILLDESNHLGFLDNFGGHRSDVEKVMLAYDQWRQAHDELARTGKRKELLKAERELLLFQVKEIKSAGINSGEAETLTIELKRLNAARSLMDSAQKIQDCITDEEHGLSNQVSLIHQELARMQAADDSLEITAKQLVEIEYQIEDIRQFIERYGSNLTDDPQRISDINERLDEIYNLKMKYGGSEEAIIDFFVKAESRLQNLPDVDHHLTRLQSEADLLLARYSELAIQLSQKRKKTTSLIKKRMMEEMKTLAIEGGDFEFELLYENDVAGVEYEGKHVRAYPHGLENGRIMFSANPGEPPKSLVKTASGGEISRLLLALKSAETIKSKKSGKLLVFDEVDVGIGGRTATEVGKKLKSLSGSNQLLVVTHLHQIARLADHHYLADKAAEEDGRTRISVKKLGGKAIKAELDRMVALPE